MIDGVLFKRPDKTLLEISEKQTTKEYKQYYRYVWIKSYEDKNSKLISSTEKNWKS